MRTASSALFLFTVILAACEDTTEPFRPKPSGPAFQSSSANQVRVTVTDLTAVLGPDKQIAALADINDAGHIAGTYVNVNEDVGRAFLWSAETGLLDLGAPDGGASWAVALNNHDAVVGRFSGQNRAFLWSRAEGMQELGMLPGASGAGPSDINDQGEVVGDINTFSRGNRAVAWTPSGEIIDLGELQPGCNCNPEADGINNLGVIVGVSPVIVPEVGLALARGFVFTPDAGLMSVGTLGIERIEGSFLYAINDRGQAAGFDFANENRLVLWSVQSGLTDVGDLGLNLFLANIRGINNSGQVLIDNVATGPGSRAFVCQREMGPVPLEPLGLGRPFGGE